MILVWTEKKASSEILRMTNSAKHTEMWFIRRIMRILWTEKKASPEILRMTNSAKHTQMSPLKSNSNMQLLFVGHFCRKQEVEHLVLADKWKGGR